MLSTRFFRKLMIGATLLASVGTMAQDQIKKFENERPDIIYQMNLNKNFNSFLMFRSVDVYEEISGVDVFDQTLQLPKYEPFVHKNGLGDYMVGEMGKQLEEIIFDTMGLDFKGAKTTFDVYDLHYKISRPRLELDFEQDENGNIEVVARIQVRKFSVTADKIYVNNNSPGISVIRHYETEENRTRMFFDRSTMTDQMIADNPTPDQVMDYTSLIDDLYLKIQAPEGRPLVVVDGAKAGSQKSANIISGELRISMIPREDGALKLKLKNFDVSLFGAKDGEDLSKYIDFELGQDTKIGSLQGIEYGQASLDLGSRSLQRIVNKKKELITKLISQPIIDQIYNDEIKQNLIKKVDELVFSPLNINPNFSQKVEDISITNRINEIGTINKDRSNPDNVNQLRLSMNVDFERAEYKNFVFHPSYKPVTDSQYEKSQKFIHNKIQNLEESLIISIDQDFLNGAIATYIEGRKKELLTDVPEYVSIGEKGVFLQFDDKNQGKLVIDMLARDKFFMRVASALVTGRSKYYFPLVMTPEISIEMKADVPTLVVKAKDIDITEDTLRNGIYGVPSNLDKGWSKKFVLKTVKNEMKPTIGSTLFEYPLVDFKGVDLSKLAKVQSDGHGRLNIMVNLLAYADQRKKLAKLPKVIMNMLKKQSNQE